MDEEIDGDRWKVVKYFELILIYFKAKAALAWKKALGKLINCFIENRNLYSLSILNRFGITLLCGYVLHAYTIIS